MEILEDILEITHIEKAQDQKIISLILSFSLFFQMIRVASNDDIFVPSESIF